MSNYPMGAEHDARAPYNQDDTLDRIVEELTMQSLSAFRNMLVERITEDIRYEMDENYSTPDGWEDVYSEYKEEIFESVYDEVYSHLTYKLTDDE